MIENVVEKLKRLIVDELDVNIKLNEIDETTSLFEEGLGLDSVAIMEFISLIETHFGFQFSDNELNMEPFQNIRTVANFISTKLVKP